jgi:hypothetical protein
VIASATGEKSVVMAERIEYRQCLTPVRALYLDLSQWAIEDPGRWAQWAAPCPVGQEEISQPKFQRHRKARMDARTRERLPVLPVLVRTVDERRKNAFVVLAAARQTPPGQAFTAAGQTLTRTIIKSAEKVWADDPVTGKRRDLGHEEDHAFWAWAAVDILRLTGCRVEELLEISHHSLIQYRLPTTGETVPLLQIVPSKTVRKDSWSSPRSWRTCSRPSSPGSANPTGQSRSFPSTTATNAYGARHPQCCSSAGFPVKYG